MLNFYPDIMFLLEQVKILYRKEREEFFIRKFDTLNEGMNRKI